jgi:DNA-binding transcriptional regulator of glucitol operon
MRQYAPFFLVFAVLWVAQLYATAKQSQHFMRSVGQLRQLGETAIGASSHNRLRRRSYVALAADDSDLVTGAIELAGVTVFSRAQPIPDLVGVPLRELADAEGTDRRSKAAAMAARALLDEELDGPAGEAPPTATRLPSGSSRSAHLPSGVGRTDVRDERAGGS